MDVDGDCYACRMGRDDAPLRERFVRRGGWRVALDFNSSLEGWLIITPLRHLQSIDELTDDEAVELGRLLRDASRALHTVTGCIKTYVMLFAEADGFAHVHFHVVPRMADQPGDRKGPAVFGHLKEQPVTEARRDELAEQLVAAWPS
ncbi:MAG: HIT family protein [Ilumatobacteraceae bacterium]|jgi:diadenosine tetraphosphate (Ap4A) HIT family hydrolase